MTKTCIAAFYHFANLDNYVDIQARLLQECIKENIMGTVLLAKEGINGTIAGSNGSIKNILTYIRSDRRLHELIHKVSYEILSLEIL